MEGKARRVADAGGVDTKMADLGPRFGFTVTKKLGGAVVRNRVRRRLKAALVEVVQSCADPHFDYVVVARDAALKQPFEALKADLEGAFRRVHKSSQTRGSRQRREASQA